MKLLGRHLSIAILTLLSAFSVHYIVFEWALDSHKDYFWKIYAFIFLLFLVAMLLIELLEKNFKEQLGYFFLVIIALKLMSVKIFMDSFSAKEETAFKISIISLYLLSLILLTWLSAKKLLTQDQKKE